MTRVSAIEYLNVRIRYFHSLLFSQSMYEDFLAGDNLGALTTFFLNQPGYSDDIGGALENVPEREGLESGVTSHFARCIKKSIGMAGGPYQKLFETALFPFDIRNVKVLLMARARGLTTQQTLNMLVPCCSMPAEKLEEILRTDDTAHIIAMISRHLPFGKDALNEVFHGEKRNRPLIADLNLIERKSYSGLLNYLDKSDGDRKVLRDIIRYEVDLKNIKTALKAVWKGEPLLQRANEALISGGFINSNFLTELTKAKGLDEAFEMIESTHFHPAVEKGIIYYAETGFLHEMERFFDEVFYRKVLSYRRNDPFGVGIFLGYVWGKYVELTNLRMIIDGIAFKLGPAQIRKGLIYV